MKHQYLTLLLTLLMSMVTSVASAHDFYVDGIYYNITSEEDLTVEVTFKGTSYSSYSNEYTGSVTIPTSVTYNEKNFSVTSIGDDAFSGCSGLTSITITEGATSIGNWSFYGCTSLISVNIPETVTSIGECAFYNCSGLTSVDIPEGVTSIKFGTFYNCSGLTSITIPKSVTSIKNYAFCNCTCLTSITIPESVTSIGQGSFQECSGLTSVTALNPIPVTIVDNTFTTQTNATLYVPCGCMPAYEATQYWNKFKSIVEIELPTEMDISVGSTGMATYYSSYDLDFTDSEAKAYVVSGFTPSTAQVILTRVYDVKAKTGILVKAPAGDYRIPIRDAETILVNMLRGVTVPTILKKVTGGYTNYILAMKNDVLGFYVVADGSTLGANKAYLPLLTSALPAAAEVKLMLVFDDEMYTGIEAPEKQEASEGDIYNLNGQRLSRMQKGVNIVGGKKVFIK